MTTRALSVTVSVVVAAAAVIGIAPAAHARPLPPSTVGLADQVMITVPEARTLGIAGKVIRTFGEIFGQDAPVDDPWLCDLDGAVEVEGRGSRNELQVEVFPYVDAGYVVENELHAYPDEARARDAYRLIQKLAPRCTGIVTSFEDRDRATYRLSNGSATTRSGTGFAWTYSRALSAKDPRDFQDNYVSFTLVGRYVQVIELESLGKATGNLTSKQRKALRQLTGTLADRVAADMP